MIPKPYWRSMMRKFSWMLLSLLVFSVYAEDEKEVVVGSADEFKGIESVVVREGKLIRPKQIIWKKDGAKMRRIPAVHQGQFSTWIARR